MRVILDLDKALMPPPDPDAEGTGINYHPDVLRFEWMDPPTFMWRMPDTVEFTGDTTFGPFKGIYKTRTRECDGYMTYKFRVVQFSGESSDDWARAKAKGIQTTDKPAITSAAESGQLWSDEKIERPKLRVIVP
jgi:hypothetical protein